MRDIAKTFGESCCLNVENNLSVLCTLEAGSQRCKSPAPLHCTGAGKLFLSCYSPIELGRLFTTKKIEKLTGRTITSVLTLLGELGHVRKAGYACDNEEYKIGMRSIAVPIRDRTGKIAAGISVGAGTAKMTDEHILENLPKLLLSAQQLSRKLGWNEGFIS